MRTQYKYHLEQFFCQQWAYYVITPLLIATILAGGWSVFGASEEQAKVLKVIDGDTVHVQLTEGQKEKIRIIGIDTPETKDPRKPVQCFGKEASKQMHKLVNGKTVVLERNPAGDRDKYKRLLRYISLNGEDIGAAMIRDGFAFSYKQFPHPRLEEYNLLEREAREAIRGLWGNVCEYSKTHSAASTVKSRVKSKAVKSKAPTTSKPTKSSCVIKGNISGKKEKIYHLPSCGSYQKTTIDSATGERWFCSEQEATAAGWRKAGNCR